MAKDLRSAIREVDAEVAVEAAALMLLAVRGAEKPGRVKCGCGRSVDAPVPDLAVRVKTIADLQALGYGKPGTQRDEGAELGESLLKDASELTLAERHLVLAEALRRANDKGEV